MTKQETLLEKAKDEFTQSVAKMLKSCMNDEANSFGAKNIYLKGEMYNFLKSNVDNFSDKLLDSILECEKPLNEMVFILQDYVCIDNALFEILEDYFVNDCESRDYIRELTYLDEEDDEYDDESEENDEDEQEDENGIDCSQEDLNSYCEYKESHDDFDEGFIHDNEDC